jgi:hypothetical protein
MFKMSDAVRLARPTLSDSSVRTYSSILSSLHRKCFSGEMNLKDFQNTKKILEFLHSKPAASRKTVLSALVVLTGLDAYRKSMAEDISTFSADMAEQKNTPKQEAALISPAQIKKIYDRLVVEANQAYHKTHKTVSDLLLISDMVIASLLSGIFIPPRRALDYCAFKVKNINPEVDNHIEKNVLVFVTYKTAKTYGEQRVTMPPPLKAILTKYLKLIPSDYLLFDSKFEPLNSVKLNQRLCNIFGKGRSINALRHSYLTNKYTDFSLEQKEMQDDMAQMGTSEKMLSTYVKVK